MNQPKTYHGIYQLVNKQKYMGLGNNPEYKSLYELKVFKWMDLNINVVKWGYENLSIPYRSRLDNLNHLYYPDIYCVILDKNKVERKYIIEIKPNHDLIPPQTINKRCSGKTLRNHLYAQQMYIKNTDKFKAATAYCKSTNMTFKILTEKDLF